MSYWLTMSQHKFSWLFVFTHVLAIPGSNADKLNNVRLCQRGNASNLLSWTKSSNNFTCFISHFTRNRTLVTILKRNMSVTCKVPWFTYGLQDVGHSHVFLISWWPRSYRLFHRIQWLNMGLLKTLWLLSPYFSNTSAIDLTLIEHLYFVISNKACIVINT